MVHENKSILVVDADRGARLYISVILKRNGYKVVEAADAAAALAALADTRPDLSIVDLATANEGGLDLCKLLRSRLDTRRHPVLVLASRSRPESAACEMAAGADRVLFKPILSANLLADVHLLLDNGGNGRAGW